MRRLLALAAAVVVAAVPTAGCGAEDLEPVSVAEAADRTRAAQTARFEMDVRLEGMGLPRAMELSAEGVTATAEPRMDMTLDLGALLALAGGSGGDGKLRILLDGARVHADPPELEGFAIPGGRQWASVDLRVIAKAIGVDPDGFGPYLRLSLEQQLDAMKAAGTIDAEGTEEIDGVQTTHFRGSVSARDHLNALPREERERVEAAVRDLERWAGGDSASLDEQNPIELWVDGEGRVRRMRQEVPVPSQEGVPAGKLTMTIDLDDFGAELDVEPPPAADTFDGTRELARLLKTAG